MRLRPPRPGYGLAWGGDLSPEIAESDVDTRRRRGLDTALVAETDSYRQPGPVCEWAPTSTELLARIRDALQQLRANESQRDEP